MTKERQTPDGFAADALGYTGKNRWNAIYTIQLGELIEHGIFDWSDPLLDWSDAAYDEAQYNRVCDYFVERYRFQEISLEPFYEWATMLHSSIVFELMPKYRPIYEALADGIDILQTSDDFEKRRRIGSDYPETLLSGNSDYISDGTDEEYEHLTEGDPTDQLAKYAKTFTGVDQLMLDDLQGFFLSLYTISANAF